MSKHNILHEEDHDYGFGVNFTKSELKEDEGHLIEGAFGTVSLLGTSLLWLIIASILISVNWIIAGWVCIGLATICVSLWAAIHVLPVIWKRLKSLPKQLVKWFFNLVQS